MFAQDDSAMQHSGNTQVVDERLFAEGLVKAEIARNGLADAVLVRTVGLGGPAQSELFAEVGMPARFRTWKLLAVVPHFAGGLNGVDDARVAGAAAQMAVERLGYCLAIAGAVVA